MYAFLHVVWPLNGRQKPQEHIKIQKNNEPHIKKMHRNACKNALLRLKSEKIARLKNAPEHIKMHTLCQPNAPRARKNA